MRVVQDANRSYSVGRLTTEAQVNTFIQTALVNITDSAVVTATEGNGSIRTLVTVPTNDLAAIGFISALTSATLAVQSEHIVEY